MMRFIRLVGGGLGVILAISLAGLGGTSSGLLEPQLEGRILFGVWMYALRNRLLRLQHRLSDANDQ